jgi:hypothetical protein
MNRIERAVSRARVRRSGRGAVDIKTVDQALYRDDLGFNMTEADYKNYQEDEVAYQSASAKSYGDLDTFNSQTAKAQGELDSAYSTLDKLSKSSRVTLDSEWGKINDGFETLRIVNGVDVEAVYKLPKEAINKLNTESFNQEGSYTGHWMEDGIYNVDVNIDGEGYGKELHEAIGGAVTKMKADFYETNAEAVARANKENRSLISSKRGELNTVTNTLASQQADADDLLFSLTSSAEARDKERDYLKTEYTESKAHRQGLFALPRG